MSEAVEVAFRTDGFDVEGAETWAETEEERDEEGEDAYENVNGNGGDGVA